ncbi:uncharacterized protein V1510DRAFT_406862 [Dipodascopsis tothii]|uniref:uncharacterized protein n=1 Tax=Dipodascopsis tothii TaxID=44089 RepID=UPI0034CF90C4
MGFKNCETIVATSKSSNRPDLRIDPYLARTQDDRFKYFNSTTTARMGRPITLAEYRSMVRANSNSSIRSSSPDSTGSLTSDDSGSLSSPSSPEHPSTSDTQKSRLTKKTQSRSIDLIDALDGPTMMLGSPYHHEGPFDATLAHRNTSSKTSPIAAVKRSNAQALQATPPGNIVDALSRKVPLDGFASIPPGYCVPGVFDGLQYEEEDELRRLDPRNVMPTQNWPGSEFSNIAGKRQQHESESQIELSEMRKRSSVRRRIRRLSNIVGGRPVEV